MTTITIQQAGAQGPGFINDGFGPWTTATAYVLNDGVADNGSSWRCKLAHTSSASNRPGTSGGATYWQRFASAGATNGLPFVLDLSSTTMADPGPGKARFDALDLTAATKLALAAESAASGNPDVSGQTSRWSSGSLSFVDLAGPETRIDLTVTAATDHGDWIEIDLTADDTVLVGTFVDGDTASGTYIADASAPAAASATAAAASASAASGSATAAASSATAAAASATAASNSATAASDSADDAESAKTAAETAQAGAEAAEAGTLASAASSRVYANTTAALADVGSGLAVGDYCYVVSATTGVALDIYLIETGPVATYQKSLADADGYAQLQFDAWKASAIGANAWWSRQGNLPDFLVDVSYGDGRAYTVAGGKVSELINLADGSSIPASHATLRATETTVDGFAALQFGGGAVTRPYIGNAVLPDLTGAISFHCVASLDTAATTNRLVTVGDQAVAVGTKRLNYQINSTLQMAIGFQASGITTATSQSPANAIANGDLVLVSTFVNLEKGEVTHWFSGAVSGYAKSAFDASDFDGTSWDKLTIGGYDTSATHVLTGALLVAAQYSGANHTIEQAYHTHANLLEIYMPDAFENVVAAIWESQSNGDGNQADIAGIMPTGNEVSFTDNTVYRWNSSTFKFYTTGIAHPAFPNARCNNPLYWFLQELMALTAADGLVIKPVFNVVTSGGVPWTSSSLWTSGSSFLGPMDEEGAGNGKNSTFETQAAVSWRRMRDTITYTPKWRDRVLMRAFVIQGFESDAGVEVPYRKALQTLDGLAQAAERELGIDTFLVIELGSQGDTTEENALSNEPNFERIREAQRDFVAARPNAFMIYDHCKENLPAWGAASYSSDNLVVDADGAWISGAGYIGGVHCSPAQYRAIGITGARNFYRSARSRFRNYRQALLIRGKPILEDY